jgi:hypothetical protein
VSLGNLGRRLRREAAANPKKAVILGVAALVAVYFWMPLVWKWIGKGDSIAMAAPVQPSTTGMVVTELSVAAPTPQPAAKQTASERPSWQQLDRWMHDDQRTMTAPPLPNTRDPFQPPKVEVVEATKAVERLKPRLTASTLSASGLALTSTIIGPQRRVAQINGKTYAVGQIIEVAKDKEAAMAFKLIEVAPRRAVLEAEGQRFELSIPEPTRSSKIELLRSEEQ